MSAKTLAPTLGLSPLEADVLDLIAEAHPDHAALILDQLGRSVIASRRRTGVGFFLNFSLEPAQLFDPPRFHMNDVYAELDGLEDGAGFVLFIREGRIDFLEGHSFGEDWPDIEDHRAFIRSPDRGLVH